jgi:hypothetical protein
MNDQTAVDFLWPCDLQYTTPTKDRTDSAQIPALVRYRLPVQMHGSTITRGDATVRPPFPSASNRFAVYKWSQRGDIYPLMGLKFPGVWVSTTASAASKAGPFVPWPAGTSTSPELLGS